MILCQGDKQGMAYRSKSKTCLARDASLVMVEFCTPAFLPQVLMSTRHQFLRVFNLEKGVSAVS